MRELKFRAWDKVEKKTLFDADPFALHVSGSNEPLLAKTHRNEDCIFEQYTGLKDKNGKEIYEGDIVVNTYYDDGEMYKVLWADDSVAFGMESLDDMELYKLPLESLEVIGNIHENPELLEGKE